MKNIYQLVTNPNVENYEDRLDKVFEEINDVNFVYSPPIIQFDKNYYFHVNKQAFRNDSYIQAIQYERIGQNQPSMLDKNQERLHQEKMEINRIILFMTEYNKLSFLERRMLCHEYFKRYFPQSFKEISRQLKISPKLISKTKKIAKEKMIVQCCLDIFTTLEYGNFLQPMDQVEDDRIIRWKKLGMEYKRTWILDD